MSGETILIIEDNEKNLKLMRDILQFKEYHTLEAETAEEGIRIAHESRPDLILLDIQLPGMNGIEALGVLRSDTETAGIPAIAVTASIMTHDRGKLIEAGFDDYQSKPIEIKEFLDSVERMLEAGRS
jgi:two-component system cell cycle response regulator DivK